MDEYVQYHNPEYADFPQRTPGPFSIYTRKAVNGLLGARVWLVARKPQTQEYYLVYWFIVEDVTAGEVDAPNSVAGRAGEWLQPPVRIDRLVWFDDFRRYLGNFGLGLQRIADQRLADALIACATQPPSEDVVIFHNRTDSEAHLR